MQLPPPRVVLGKQHVLQDRNVKVFEQLNRISTCSKVGCLEEEGAW